MKKYLILLLIVAATFALGCAEEPTEYKEGNVSEVAEEPEIAPLEIIESKLQENEGEFSVTGSAVANQPLSYAEVKVKYYDGNGAVIYSDFTNIVDLGEGETWNFEVYGPYNEDVKNYTIAVGDCSY